MTTIPPIQPPHRTSRVIIPAAEEEDRVIVDEQPAVKTSSMKAKVDAHDTLVRRKLVEMNVIQETLTTHSPVISSEQVLEICKITGLGKEGLLQQLVAVAKTTALPWISEYKVGAAGLGKSGKIYLGGNLEFPCSTLKESVHAEQSLVVLMRNGKETGIEAIALSAPPCGHCRQFLREIGDEGLNIKFLIPGHPILTLDQLLPYSFGPKDLGKTGEMLSHPKKEYKLDHQDLLTVRAMEAAYDSYCPYTNARSGVAIKTSSGKIYRGSYLENAAHNPSVSPLQSALIALLADGKEYRSIFQVLLVEKKGHILSHASASRTILEAIAPLARFQCITSFEDT